MGSQHTPWSRFRLVYEVCPLNRVLLKYERGEDLIFETQRHK